MLDPDLTVARVVLDHSETASVFQRHRIDYCCKGGRSLRDAAADRGLDAGALLSELEHAITARVGDAGIDLARTPTARLIAHIVGTHHEYLRTALPFVRKLAAKVARVHGDHQPTLHDVEATVVALDLALAPHLDAEERTLFPALLTPGSDRAAIRAELATMYEEHLAVGALLDQLRASTLDYQPPEWACNSYRTLFAELARLDDDVRQHVHIENHILMPRFTEQ